MNTFFCVFKKETIICWGSQSAISGGPKSWSCCWDIFFCLKSLETSFAGKEERMQCRRLSWAQVVNSVWSPLGSPPPGASQITHNPGSTRQIHFGIWTNTIRDLNKYLVKHLVRQTISPFPRLHRFPGKMSQPMANVKHRYYWNHNIQIGTDDWFIQVFIQVDHVMTIACCGLPSNLMHG